MLKNSKTQTALVLFVGAVLGYAAATGAFRFNRPAEAGQGIPEWAPTIPDLLKAQGYVAGQFGKNHLGDQNSHLPTVHGFERV